MEVYGEVTMDPDDERKYKCVADCEPQPWDCDAASTEDGGSSGGGTDAASAGFIALYVVVGAALAAIAFGAYWYMRSQGGAEPPMVEVEEMASAPVPRKDQLYAAVPVASAPRLMPPPPPTGRNFCTACGAPVQGPFCGGCGARAQ
jgi:hypothetical protein